MLNVYYVHAHICCAYRGRRVTEQYLERKFSSKKQRSIQKYYEVHTQTADEHTQGGNNSITHLMNQSDTSDE